MTRPFSPGDVVERTGESAIGIEKGSQHVVVSVSDDGWLCFSDHDGDVEYSPRGFRLVQPARKGE